MCNVFYKKSIWLINTFLLEAIDSVCLSFVLVWFILFSPTHAHGESIAIANAASQVLNSFANFDSISTDEIQLWLISKIHQENISKILLTIQNQKKKLILHLKLRLTHWILTLTKTDVFTYCCMSYSANRWRLEPI